MPTILDGKKTADIILSSLKKERNTIPQKTKLGIILVGKNPASVSYINQKKKVGQSLNIEVEIFNFDSDISTRKLRGEIGKICRSSNMRGVIVQLPLPDSINKQAILNSVIPDKDIDALSNAMSGKIYTNTYKILPPTVGGIMHLIDKYEIEIQGKVVAVVGTGILVGRPTATVLSHKKASCILMNKNTKNPKELISQADIVISGTGNKNFITQDMIKKDAIIIDAGYELEDKRAQGDFHPDAYKKASHYTPVPGGIGPMTVAMLYWNLFELNRI